MKSPTSIVAVDLGKTGCRAQWRCAGDLRAQAHDPGGIGLAGPDGVRTTAAVIGRVVDRLEAHDVDAVGIGLVGHRAAADRVSDLIDLLGPRWPGAIIRTASDVTTTHLGALDGRPGTVIAAGTGAVALAIGSGGHAIRDGWGYLLGDDGSGHAIGRLGVRAALAAHEAMATGRAGHEPRLPASDLLARAAEERFGSLATLPAVIHGSDNPARLLASFAPDVARAAEAGDPVARAICTDAADALARTAASARAAVGDTGPIVIAGGLAALGAPLTEPFTARAAHHADAPVVPTQGTALDGAATLAGWATVPAEFADLIVEGRGSDSPAPGGLGSLATESADPTLLDLDQRPTPELLRTLWEAEARVPSLLLDQADAVAAAVDAITERMRRGGRLTYVGAGTPGRLAFVDASEIPPTYGTDPSLVVAVIAGGLAAFSRAIEGAEDDPRGPDEALGDLSVGPDDSVIGLTASGRTPFVLRAMATARERGALTVGVSNNAGAELSGVVDHAIEVLTGPEVVAGSTRLKGGTTQKLMLNAISTAVMIRLGKTFGPYMVDMRATNEKLRARAVRMVATLAAVEPDAATDALASASWHTATAIVMLRTGLDAEAAHIRLQEAGSVRAAIGSLDPGATGTQEDA